MVWLKLERRSRLVMAKGNARASGQTSETPAS